MARYVPIKQAYNTFEAESGVDITLAPVIFLHGVLSCKESWLDVPQIIARETKRKVYNVDMRNHGESEWTDEFDFVILAKDVLDFMNTVGCSKAILVSHSMGGRIAIQVALEHPDKVEKIVVEEMMVRKPAPTLLGFPMAFSTLAPKAIQKIPKDANEEEATKIIMKHVCDALPSESVKKFKLDQVHKSTLGLKKTSEGGYAFKVNMNVLARKCKIASSVMTVPEGLFNGPALFIYGKASPYEVLKQKDHIKEYFPKAEFVGIDDAMHTVHHDKPKEFLEAILKFLL